MLPVKPNQYFTRISKVDIRRDLIDRGITHVFLDVDNTILTRDTHEIPADVAAWLDKASDQGLKLCLLSNNWHGSVRELADRMGLPVVAKACKPLPFSFFRAMRKTGARPSVSVMVGDQLFTDVLGSNLVGMRSIYLQPLVEQDLRHTLVVRKLERRLVKNEELLR